MQMNLKNMFSFLKSQKNDSINTRFVFHGIVLVVLFISLFISFLFFQDLAVAFRFAAVLVFGLYLPGALLEVIIFQKKQLNLFEQIILSIVFSLVLFPIPVFIAYSLGVVITVGVTAILLVILNLLLVLILVFKSRRLF